MKRSPPNETDTHTRKKVKLSIIIPSSPDRNFEEVIQNLREIRPPGIDFQILAVKGKWLPTQRNLAIKHAKGDFIFLFDDDIIIPQKSIQAALKTFTDEPAVQVVGGPNITPAHDSFLQHCFGYAHASFFAGAGTAVRYYPAKNLHYVNGNQLITCNLAFRADILKKFLFDPQICPNEENDLLERIRFAGGLLVYNKDFFVYHHRRDTVYKYLRQIFKWGQGRTLHAIKRPRHFNPLFLVPALFLIYLVAVAAAIIAPLPLQQIFLWPLWLYLSLDLCFTFYSTVTNKNPAAFFVLIWLLPLTHLAYGLGTISGMKYFFKKTIHHPPESAHKLTEINIETA